MSESESDLFESAEESLEEDEEENKRKKSGKSKSIRNVEIEEPAVQEDSIRTSHQEREKDSTRDSVTYRKRPEKVKQLPKNLKTAVTSQLSLSKTDVIAPDNFFQDITTNLSKNINKSLNTIQQTSSNVKDLIMSSLPVPGANENEVFCYDEATLVSPKVESENPLNKTLSQLSLSDVIHTVLSENLGKVDGNEIENKGQQLTSNIVEKEIVKPKDENKALTCDEDYEVVKNKTVSCEQKEKLNLPETSEFLDVGNDSNQQEKGTDIKAIETNVSAENISESINTFYILEENGSFSDISGNKIESKKPFKDSSNSVHSIMEKKSYIFLDESDNSVPPEKLVCDFQSKEINKLKFSNLKPVQSLVGFEKIQCLDKVVDNCPGEYKDFESENTELYVSLKECAGVTETSISASPPNKNNVLIPTELSQQIYDNLPKNNINDNTQQLNIDTNLGLDDINWNNPVNDFVLNKADDSSAKEIEKDLEDFSFPTERQKKVCEDSNANEMSLQNEIIDENNLKNICNDQYVSMNLNEQETIDAKEGWDDFDFSDSQSDNSEMNVSLSPNKNGSWVNQNKDSESSSNNLPLINLNADKTNKSKASLKNEKSDSHEVEVLKEPSLSLSTLEREKIKQKMTEAKPVKLKKKELSNETIAVKQPESLGVVASEKISEQNQEGTDDDWNWNNWGEEEESNENSNNNEKKETPEISEKLGPEIWSGWDTFGQKQDQKASKWGSWGVNMLLDKATAVTQGISNVLEAGLGAPDPETLARMEKMEENKQENQNLENTHGINDTNSLSDVNLFSTFGITDLVAGVTSKLVEKSKFQEIGSKVISGGLDTLESFGKKTMEVLQEGDPGLRNKRALLLGGNKPVLSQVLKEARDKAEKEIKEVEEKELERKCNFERLFDDFQGILLAKNSNHFISKD